jgi:hypothetical protein
LRSAIYDESSDDPKCAAKKTISNTPDPTIQKVTLIAKTEDNSLTTISTQDNDINDTKYKGKSDGDEELGLALGPAVFKIIAESFLKWTKLFNYDVSQEDIEKISSGHVYLLSGDTKKYYDIFYSVLLKKYMTAWGESLKDLAV